MRDLSKQSGRLAAAALFALVLGLFPELAARAGDVANGKISAIKEGNLVTFDYGGGTYDVRIVGVVVPENASAVAREYLEKLLNKPARLRFEGGEPGGVVLGKIYASDPETGKLGDVGLAMIRAGVADLKAGETVYKYDELSHAKIEAQSSKRGMWVDR